MAKIPFFKISLIIVILLVMVVAVLGFIPDFNLPGGGSSRFVVECNAEINNPTGIFGWGDVKFNSVTCAQRSAGIVDCALPFAIPVLEDEVTVTMQVGASSISSPQKIFEGQSKVVNLKTCVTSDPSTAKVSILSKDNAVITSRDVAV